MLDFMLKAPRTFAHPKTGELIRIDDDVFEWLSPSHGKIMIRDRSNAKQRNYNLLDAHDSREGFERLYEVGPTLYDEERQECYWTIVNRLNGVKNYFSQSIAQHFQDFTDNKLRFFGEPPRGRAMMFLDFIADRDRKREKDQKAVDRLPFGNKPADDPPARREATPDDLPKRHAH